MLNNQPENGNSRALPALKAASAILLAVILVLFAWEVSGVLLTVFAGILLAIFFRTISDWVSSHAGISAGWAVAITISGLLLALVGILWLIAPRLASEVEVLADQLPKALTELRGQLQQREWGRVLVERIQAAADQVAEGGSVLSRVMGYASTVLDAIVAAIVILFVGIYLAADPGRYRRGVLKLFPHARRARTADILTTVATTLRRWVVARILLMVVNGLLTAVGLLLLGMPLAFVLGMIAGVLNFIPNFGPIIAAVPAILVAFGQRPTLALYVALLYLAVQMLDGYVFTPLAQQRAVELPPALIISFQVAMGTLFGVLGLLIATPFAAAGFVLVKMAYVQDVLGDDVSTPET